MTQTENVFWEFGSFRLDASQRLLFRNGQLAPLSPKAADILVLLVEKHGQLVEKDVLMKEVWPDCFVEEANLAVHISQLRKTLSDEKDSSYIETIPRRGYRFVGAVTCARTPVDGAKVSEPVLPTPQAAAIETPQPAGPTEIEPLAKSKSSRSLLIGVAGLLLCATVLVAWWIQEKGKSAQTAASPASPNTLAEKDSIVLADIANNTGEPVFDTTLRQAIAIELEQSPFLSLLPESRMQESLRLMGKPADSPLTPEIARELCQRTDSAAVLDGWIAKLGTQYVLGLRAVNCRSGDHMADLQVTAASKDQVLKALGDATGQLRSKLGESLATVQKFDTPIEEATTSSLEALQAYSIGRATMIQRGESASCVPFFRKAIRSDPDFAIAYAALGNAYSNLGETGQAADNIKKAYILREHVSEREKLYIESHYYQFVTGDLGKAQQSLEQWAEIYPQDVAPRTNLAVIYSNLGKFDPSLQQAKEAVRIAPDNGQNYANLVNAYISLNQPGDAKSTAQEALARKLDSPILRLYTYDVAFLERDTAGMQQQITWSAGEPGVEDSFLDSQASTAAFFGQLAKARELTDRASVAAKHSDEKETAAGYELNDAQREAVFGNLPEARRRAETALSLAKDHDTQYGAAVALAFAGDTSRANAIANQLNQRFPEDTVVQFCYLPVIRSAVALKQNDWRRALKELDAAAPYDLGVAGGLFPVYMRGLSYLAAKDGDRAAIEFQKIADHPGVALNSPIAAVVQLQIGRAAVLSGNRKAAKTAYEKFFVNWKDADPDIPILTQAKTEYAKLP
jgi:DNA-binding winged helix-turn-helix (wHTH) protein/tetratricopeptide (TPR) repeat protein